MSARTGGRSVPESPFVPLGGVALAGAVLIALDQAFQVALSLEGTAWSPSWRFQVATSTAARVVPIVLAVLAAWAGLQARRAGAAVGLLASLTGLAGVALAVGGVLLWFDGQAVRGGLQADELSAFVAQWLRGLVFCALGAGFLVWLAWAVRKTRS